MKASFAYGYKFRLLFFTVGLVVEIVIDLVSPEVRGPDVVRSIFQTLELNLACFALGGFAGIEDLAVAFGKLALDSDG